MSITTGRKIKLVRKALNMSQEEFGALFNLTQGAVSQMESKDVAVPQNIAKYLNEKHAVSLQYWYDDDASGMFLNVAEEPTVSYGIDKWTAEQASKRFSRAIEDYLVKSGQTVVELSEKWPISYPHLKNVLNGNRDITYDILTMACKYAGISANYVVANVGGMYLDSADKAMKDIQGQLKEIKEAIGITEKLAKKRAAS